MDSNDSALSRPPSRNQGLAAGTLLVFGAESLALPLGLLLTALLTRRLGVEDYGRYTLVATVIAWIEWTLSSMWTRATIKLVGEADDWRPIGHAAVRLSLGVGIAAALVVALFAQPLSHFFHEPMVALPLLLFAIDLPLFCLAQAHRSLLVGTGDFRGRAMVTVGRALFRLLFVVLLVVAGFGVTGAVLGSIGASVVELLVARLFIRPRVFGASPANSGTRTVTAQRLWEAAGPLLIYAVSLRLFEKLDLFALKALGGTARDAGLYGAAQNIAILPGVFSMAFVPTILASVGSALREEREIGSEQQARAIGQSALRTSALLLPLGAIVAGCAPEIVSLLFGSVFSAASPLLGLLFTASLVQSLFATATALLTAGDRIWWTALLGGAMLPLAFVGHLLVIPQYGATGAATVSLITSLVAMGGALLAVYWRWRVCLPMRTLGRVIAGSLAVYAVIGWIPWTFPIGVDQPLTGLYLWASLLGKALLLTLTLVLTYALLGEWSVGERERFRAALSRRWKGALP